MYFLLYICRKLRYYREQLLNFIQICDEESRITKDPREERLWLEVLYRKFTEDHLGEAPIRHGDSVIIKNEVTATAVNRVEPRD